MLNDEILSHLRLRMLSHLKRDVLPFWTLPSVIGCPVGNFPTYISQTGTPDLSRPQYTRMLGRRIYAYLASYYMTKDSKLLNLGLSGLNWLSRLQHPIGGYYSTSQYDGDPCNSAISIQDQCYSVMPYVTAYRITGKDEYFVKIHKFIDFIDNGPYKIGGNDVYVDSLYPDYIKIAPFKTNHLNIVSVIDFLNVVLIPFLTYLSDVKLARSYEKLLLRWCDFLVDRYFANGIFWNDTVNRTDWSAEHVDLGHTSKAYGVLLKTTRVLSKWSGDKDRYNDVIAQYPRIVMAASDRNVGWRTDFDGCATKFRCGEPLWWWRHILINQTVFLYTLECQELITTLLNGIDTWFELDFIDRHRESRGIRESLTYNGKIIDDSDAAFSKANFWKSGYHEVEHVFSFFE